MQYIKQTIAQLLVENANTYPDKTFLISEERSLTFRELYRLSSNKAQNLLQTYSVSSNDYVGIYAGNSLEWVISFFALQLIGAKTVLFNPYLKHEELHSMMEKHKISLLLYAVCKENGDTIENLKKGRTESYRIQDIKMTHSQVEASLQDLSPLISPFEDYRAIASVIFTSGSTGVQKGVMLSHYSFLNNAQSVAQIMNWGSEDIVCVSVPFFHCFGLTTCFLTSIVVKSTLCIVEDLSTSVICSAVETFKCTILNGVPTMFLAITRKYRNKEFDLSSIRSGIIAGSPIYKKDYIEICETLPHFSLQPSYGQSETSPCISICSLDDALEVKSRSVGKAIHDVELRVRDLESGEILGVNELGEIETKGYHVMHAYLNDEEETKAVLGEDSWLKTGDIGFIDSEGYLHLEGRKKNLIIRAGENISPLMIENCIKNFDSGLEVIVMGVKSEVTQEEIAACIIHRGDDRDLEAKLRSHLASKVPSYAIPKYFLFFDDFIRTSVGKVDFRALSEQARKLIDQNGF